MLGDLIQIETILGTRSYRVARLFVVEPVDVQVLANTGVDQLTLVTCYPFHYIGHAPQRYIVRADEEIIVQIPAINHNNQSQPKLTEDV